MRTLRLIPLFLITSLWVMSGVVHAAPYPMGAYEFEDCGANCTTSGSWLVQDNGAQQYLVSAGASTDYVEFDVTGTSLVIYRAISPAFPSMDVCVDGGCTTVVNSNSVTLYFAGYATDFGGGTHTIRIVGSNVYLDQFIVLDQPSGSFPTPVPTATAIPTSTPMNTPVDTPTPMDTPVDTPTPIATATPVTFVWAVDPASRYHMVNGQIVRDDYSVSGGDHTITILLVIVAISSVISLVANLWKR